MEYVNIELDAYEIANKVFSENSEIDKNISFESIDIKTFFEMMLIITTEGLKKFYGDNDHRVDITKLTIKDIEFINNYLKKIYMCLNFRVLDTINYAILKSQNLIKNYKEMEILNDTQLKDINYIVIKKNLNLVYIFNFDYINSS